MTIVRRSAVEEDDADMIGSGFFGIECGREQSEGRKQRRLLMKATFVSIMAS